MISKVVDLETIEEWVDSLARYNLSHIDPIIWNQVEEVIHRFLRRLDER